ncbi:hypothetical protein NE237_025397 [Protea cynaroides]|uniref:Uncharacterized protein n=1 Tax=Protea cynaroides TaxID=273540 RepID=A0A9Q0H452_9MAGN|nr:hypothetical protein NE237_025397 [Protea cynaroides]
MCTSPPRRSTHAPSLRVSIGHVFFAGAGGDGQGLPLGGVVTGGFKIGGTGTTGGIVTGGMGTTGGIVTGGMGTTGGTVTGGMVTGGMVTGGMVTGGLMTGGLTTGGFTLGGFTGLCLGGGFPQDPQPRMGEAEEMKSMRMKRRDVNLEESMAMDSSSLVRRTEKTHQRERVEKGRLRV